MNDDKSELSFKNFKKVIDEFTTLKPFLYFSGGEPTLNNDIFKMISYADEKGFITSMVTNGINLNEKYRNISDCGLRFITVSIDGFKEDHDKLRGLSGAFDKTVDGLKKLVFTSDGSLHIKVNITINRKNYYYLFDLVKFIFCLNVDEVSLQHFSFYNPKIGFLQTKYAKRYGLGYEVQGARIDSQSYLSEKQIAILKKELIKIRKSKLNVDFDETHVNDIKKYYSGEFPSKKSKCKRVTNELHIRGNGDVEICPGYILGNINNSKIMEVFRGRKAEHLRNVIKRDLIPACYRCCKLNFNF